ncbi:U-box domain-containing protein 1 [Nymphaea colorata]|uniref:U-box domain-containing protein n=1 Tax=Nymphaea colorata TaxID=210225 RepID=A0A5K0WDU7_9MAGN|nr:U-box domain-containing protein 1 [Nymphaea colorata]
MGTRRRTVRSLVAKLTRAATPDREQAEAVAELRLLSKVDGGSGGGNADGDDYRLAIAEEGAIPFLVGALRSEDATLQENAITTLLNLSTLAPNRELIMSARGLSDAILHVLRFGATSSAVRNAAATVYSLLIDEPFRPILGSKPEIVSAVVDLLRSPDAGPMTTKDALRALFVMALYPLNRPKLVDSGVVPALFSLLISSPIAGIVDDATAVAAQVAGCTESLDAFRAVSGIRVLVALLESGSGRAKENAASALLNLARCGGDEAVREILTVDSVVAAATDLVDVGSERARSKASALLSILGVQDILHPLSDGSNY